MKANKTLKNLMNKYGFIRIAEIVSPAPHSFKINIVHPEAEEWEKSIYIFSFNNEIVRIGSSKGKLKYRLSSWGRSVTYALHKTYNMGEKRKSSTPEWEALEWEKLLNEFGSGHVYARVATEVTTPVGTFPTYMDEESVLINRYKPRLNRHKNR